MPALSHALPSHWPQLSDWQITAAEAPGKALFPSAALSANLTGTKNRLPEGHAVRLTPPPRRTSDEPNAQHCRTLQINDYVRNVLVALVTPKAGCAAQRYTSNAELRESMRTAIAFYPEGNDKLLEVTLKALGLPSLLREEAKFMPGTLEALRYDVGVRRVDIEGAWYPDLKTANVQHLQAVGERDLAVLDAHDARDAHNARVTTGTAIAHNLARILDFHYRASGMPGDVTSQALAETDKSGGTTHRPLSRVRPSEFAAHLERCQPISNLPRARRKAAGPTPRYPLVRPHDPIYNCSIL